MAERSRSFQYNERVFLTAAHLLAALMTLCFAWLLITFGDWLFYGWEKRGLLTACFLVIVEATLSYRLVRHWDATLAQKVVYRLGEAILLGLLLKLVTEARYGFEHFLDNLLAWPFGFGRYFFTGEFVFNLILFFLVWLLATFFAVRLHELEHVEEMFYWGDVQRPYQPVHRKILNLYLTAGLFMILLTGVMRQDFFVLSKPPPRLQADLLILVTYFLSGLILLSLAYFAHLRGKWGYEGAQISRDLASRWLFYGATFLVLLTGVALALPTNYSLLLLDALRLMILWLVAIAQFLMAVVALAFLYLASFLSRLLGREAETLPVDETPPRLEDFAPPPSGGGVPFWETLKAILFWAALLTVVWLALRQYLQANRELAETLQRFAPWRWLRALWQWLRGGYRQARQGVGKAVRTAINRLRALTTPRPARPGWQYLNLRQLTPRQRVIFYYLALLRRADEAGIHRQDWQTPLEFSQRLAQELPENEAHVLALTEAFDEARYTAHPVTEQDAGHTRSLWEQMRVPLQRRKRGRQRTIPS
jgi:hypothetical protein